MQIYERLANRMKQLGLKQVDVVKATGLNKSSVSLILKGDRKPVGDTLVKLSKALNTTPEWIQTGEDRQAINSVTLDKALLERAIKVVRVAEFRSGNPLSLDEFSNRVIENYARLSDNLPLDSAYQEQEGELMKQAALYAEKLLTQTLSFPGVKLSEPARSQAYLKLLDFAYNKLIANQKLPEKIPDSILKVN